MKKRIYHDRYIKIGISIGIILLVIVVIETTRCGISNVKEYISASPYSLSLDMSQKVLTANALDGFDDSSGGEPSEGEYGEYYQPESFSEEGWMTFGEAGSQQTPAQQPVSNNTETPAQSTNIVPTPDVPTPTQYVPVPQVPQSNNSTPVVRPTTPKPAAPAILTSLNVIVKEEVSGANLAAHVIVRSLNGSLLGEGDTDPKTGIARVNVLSKEVHTIGSIDAIQGRMRKVVPFRHGKVTGTTSIKGPTISLAPSKVDETYDPSLTETVLIPFGFTSDHAIDYQNVTKNSESIEVTKRPFVSTVAGCPLAIQALSSAYVTWPLEKTSSRMKVSTTVSVPSDARTLIVKSAIDNRVNEILLNGSVVWTNSASKEESINHGCATPRDHILTLAAGTFTPGGKNTIEFSIEDYGVENYFDFQISAHVPTPEIVIPPKETFFQYIYRSVTDIFTF
ncbi:MAG: hypothetical protein V4519_04630 [Patescibacteria group bacterium]